MQYKKTLQARITLSFFFFAAILSIVMTVGVYFAFEDIESELVDEKMNAELAFVLQNNPPQDNGKVQVTFDTEFVYLRNDADSELLTFPVRTLKPGLHERKFNGHSIYVLVNDYQDGKIYLIKNAKEFEQREKNIHIALLLVVIFSCAISLWLGRRLAGKVISPVTNLANQVEKLKPSGNYAPNLALNYASDEVGMLAASFDAYLKQLQQLIQREQEFTGDVSHELRTPLAVMQGAAELLSESNQLGEREKKQVERILRACERMAQMLDILLMLARELPSGAKMTSETCSAQEVVLELIEQHRFLLRNERVQLRAEIVADFAIDANKNVLAMVIGNIVKNAIEHTEQGEIRVGVNDRAITIQDTGKGIDNADKELIFERLYRGSNNKVSGSGIGLAIVKRICDRQHWRIDVESEVGVGTTVRIGFCNADKELMS